MNAIPTCVAISLTFTESGLPLSASKPRKTRCPPSRTGIGRRLRTPRFTLTNATKRSRLNSPLLADLVAIATIVTGPPIVFFIESWPEINRARISTTIVPVSQVSRVAIDRA